MAVGFRLKLPAESGSCFFVSRTVGFEAEPVSRDSVFFPEVL